MNNADTSVLPLQQKGDEEAVLTEFWADNWANVSKETRRNTINTTTIIVFQESSIGAVCIECEVSIPKTKSEEATVKFDKYNKVFYDKHEPNIISFERVENKSNISLLSFHANFSPGFIYVIATVLNIYPNLSEMLMRLWQKQFQMQSTAVSKTIETYLPLLTKKSPLLRQYIHTSSTSSGLQRK